MSLHRKGNHWPHDWLYHVAGVDVDNGNFPSNDFRIKAVVDRTWGIPRFVNARQKLFDKNKLIALRVVNEIVLFERTCLSSSALLDKLCFCNCNLEVPSRCLLLFARFARLSRTTLRHPSAAPRPHKGLIGRKLLCDVSSFFCLCLPYSLTSDLFWQKYYNREVTESRN